ncbi:MAG: hypothetical protein Q9203_007626, partial [Teloschistes exilis]
SGWESKLFTRYITVPSKPHPKTAEVSDIAVPQLERWCYSPNNKAGGPSWYGPVGKDCKGDTAEESTFLKRGMPITDDNLADAAMKKEISKRWESLKTPWRGEDNLCFKDPYGGLVDCDFCECSEG